MEDDDLELAWRDVIARWDDDETHKRYLVLADATDRLAHAASHYRAVREGEPERRAVAERRIDEIIGKAVARMKVVEASEPSRARHRVEWIGFGVSAVLIVAALWQMIR